GRWHSFGQSSGASQRGRVVSDFGVPLRGSFGRGGDVWRGGWRGNGWDRGWGWGGWGFGVGWRTGVFIGDRPGRLPGILGGMALTGTARGRLTLTITIRIIATTGPTIRRPTDRIHPRIRLMTATHRQTT